MVEEYSIFPVKWTHFRLDFIFLLFFESFNFSQRKEISSNLSFFQMAQNKQNLPFLVGGWKCFVFWKMEMLENYKISQKYLIFSQNSLHFFQNLPFFLQNCIIFLKNWAKMRENEGKCAKIEGFSLRMCQNLLFFFGFSLISSVFHFKCARIVGN